MAVGDALPIDSLTDATSGSVAVNGPVSGVGALDLAGTSGASVSAAGTTVTVTGSATDPNVGVDVNSSSASIL